MDQELGKHEEEIENTSAAGLSDSGTASAVDETSAAEDIAGATADASTADEQPSAPTEAESQAPEEANGLRRGALVDGEVISASPTEVRVKLGEDVEGIITSRELSTMNPRTVESLKPGATIKVFVVNPRTQDGKTLLSITRAQEETDWIDAESYRQSRDVYDGKIGGYNRGGLIVKFGRLRGFIPQSQIAEERLREMSGETPEERYGRAVGQNISVKVMEVDRPRNRLILSERAAMREVRQRRKESLITELQPGEIREGRVVSLENFGAFVDIGGAEGLIHLTEITWRHITHPRQALTEGQDVRVKVISVDPDQNRIGLSIRQLLPDPWDEIALAYGDGALVKGTITKLTKFGAFARIETGDDPIEGLIHISELSDDRVEHPRDAVQKGDTLTLRVVKVDVKNRRLGLSIKKVHSTEYMDMDIERAFRDAEQGNAVTTTSGPRPAVVLPDEDDVESSNDESMVPPEDWAEVIDSQTDEESAAPTTDADSSADLSAPLEGEAVETDADITSDAGAQGLNTETGEPANDE
jgi:small subunit ribosomal protein S1